MPNDDANRNTKDRGAFGDSRFTPGPWTYDRSGGVWAYEDGTFEADLCPIATIATDPEREVPENGYLIAAAPDLFAALSEMADRFKALRHLNSENAALHRQAEAALAKALPHPSPDRKDQP